MMTQSTNDRKLIAKGIVILFFIKYCIPITKNTSCAIKKGMVNIS